VATPPVQLDGVNFYFMANTQVGNWKNEQIVDAKKLAAVSIAMIRLP
jgi:hypothetical protein